MDGCARLVGRYTWLMDKCARLVGRYTWLMDISARLVGIYTWLMDRCARLVGRYTWLMDRCAMLVSRYTWLMDRCAMLVGWYTWLMDRCARACQSIYLVFKCKRSTKMCTIVLKETLAYYASNGGSLYFTFLDGTKLFDRVNYVKSFKLLVHWMLRPVSVLLLLNMWQIF